MRRGSLSGSGFLGCSIHHSKLLSIFHALYNLVSTTVLGKRTKYAVVEKMLLFNKLTKTLTLILLIIMSSTCGDLNLNNLCGDEL